MELFVPKPLVYKARVAYCGNGASERNGSGKPMEQYGRKEQYGGETLNAAQASLGCRIRSGLELLSFSRMIFAKTRRKLRILVTYARSPGENVLVYQASSQLRACCYVLSDMGVGA